MDLLLNVRNYKSFFFFCRISLLFLNEFQLLTIFRLYSFCTKTDLMEIYLNFIAIRRVSAKKRFLTNTDKTVVSGDPKSANNLKKKNDLKSNIQTSLDNEKN